MLFKDIKKDDLTPMMKQYYDIKSTALDSILMYRLGDFYEMFFDDAIKASKSLGLALTSRDCGLDERAPMCGVPFHAANQYIKRLLNDGYKVTICEQLEEPGKGKSLVERGIVKVYTPGTIIDDEFLDNDGNNYISSLYYNPQLEAISLISCDISTGELIVNDDFATENDIQLIDELNLIEPSEIITNHVIINNILKNENYNINVIDADDNIDKDSLENLLANIKADFSIDKLNKIQVTNLYLLFKYLVDNKNFNLSHFDRISFNNIDEYMYLGENTIKNLELTKTIIDGTRRGSLIDILDHTSTPKRKRLLKIVVEKPLLDMDKINERLDLVESFYRDSINSELVKNELKYTFDIERILSKIASGIAGPRDLLNLRASLEKVPIISKLLESFKNDSNRIMAKIILEPHLDLYNLLFNAINDDAPVFLSDGNVIRSGYNEDLDKLRYDASHISDILINYEKELKEITQIKTLRLKYNKIAGYFIEISKGQIDKVPETFKRTQTLKNVERYTTAKLSEIEYKVLNTSKLVLELEKNLFKDILLKCSEYINSLKDLAYNLARLDVLLSLAETARLNNYIRPNFNSNSKLELKDARHPTVELNNNLESFIPNDAIFDDNNRFAIITGPNMSGKSTYMRTIAINQLMAQIGSFVPASYADLSIVDKIFTRIGASDALSRGKSTFMIEMTEVAEILNNATKDSLIIFDEVGRGTSTYDGMAIAFSIIEYVAKNIKAKTIFSTHYQELSKLEGELDGVFNITLAIREQNNDIVFLRKVIRGITSKSYGIHVAKLAGLPEVVIEEALNYQDKIMESVGENSVNMQYNFLEKDNRNSELIDKIEILDIDSLSPREALDFLYDLKERMRNED